MHLIAAVDMSKKELLIVVYYNAVITWLIQYTSQMTCHEIITKVRLQICGLQLPDRSYFCCAQ